MSTNPYSSPTSASDEHSEPIKIKVYGLIPMTRNTYLAIQVVAAVAFVVVMVGFRPVFAQPNHTFGFINDFFWIILLVALGYECFETMVMLSKFKNAEQEEPEGI